MEENMKAINHAQLLEDDEERFWQSLGSPLFAVIDDYLEICHRCGEQVRIIVFKYRDKRGTWTVERKECDGCGIYVE